MIIKLTAFWTIVKTQAADIWNRSKVFLIALAVVLISLEWQKIKEFLIVYSGKKEIEKDQAKDAGLAKVENKDNAQADALVTKAQNEPNPGDDWNTK